MTDALIDWTRVAELRDEVGEEDFPAVVEMFLADTEDVLNRLRTGAVTEAQLHYLKGSALTMGFTRLAGLCREGEAAAARGLSDGVDPAAIAALFRASRAAFLDPPARSPLR